jgi:hypothetical protein
VPPATSLTTAPTFTSRIKRLLRRRKTS